MPADIEAVLLDLDGVVTDTASLHVEAWTQVFDTFLVRYGREAGNQQAPFDPVDDYRSYVDGRPRDEGVRSFVTSRGITLPTRTDRGEEDVESLAQEKTDLYSELLAARGPGLFEGSLAFLKAAVACHVPLGVVSGSRHCQAVLISTGAEQYFTVRVDGVVAHELGLEGKPAPDTFIYAAELLDTPVERVAVFEDAQAGVAAARAGNFGWVVGVDRFEDPESLRTAGADDVISDLGEYLTEGLLNCGAGGTR